MGMSRQDVTSSVSDVGDAQNRAGGTEPVSQQSTATRSDAPVGPPETAGSAHAPMSRRRVILAWSLGPAAAYALLSLAHAALVERILSIDVGFGRSLAFWVGTIYLALLGWGFLPARPVGWYAQRRLVIVMLALGVV